MNKIIYSIVFAILFWAENTRAELLPIESFNLNNGLQVIVIGRKTYGSECLRAHHHSARAYLNDPGL